jgi:hypothetical protein
MAAIVPSAFPIDTYDDEGIKFIKDAENKGKDGDRRFPQALGKTLCRS